MAILESKEKMNSACYLKVLGQELQWTQRDLYPEGNLVFQDDNAPCHRSKVVKTWFKDNNIE